MNQKPVSIVYSLAQVPENVNTKFSISADSEGRQLSDGQKEYFKDNQDTRYSVSGDDYSDFDYSSLTWAEELGILTKKDYAIFVRTINNEILRGLKPQTPNGEYILDTGKCLMFTDGDFHRPTLSRVIVFATEFETLTADAKELIINDAKITGEIQKSLPLVKTLFGDEFVSVYDSPVVAAYGWQNGRGKGSYSGRTNSKVRSLKERLKEEGYDNFSLSNPDEDIAPIGNYNVYGKGVALATLDNSASNRYNNNINVMEGAEENGRTVRNADIGNGVGRPQSGLDTVDSTREYDSDGSAELPKIVRLSPKTQEALSQSGVVSLELVDSSDNSSAFSVALDEARASDKENGWAVRIVENVQSLLGSIDIMAKNAAAKPSHRTTNLMVIIFSFLLHIS